MNERTRAEPRRLLTCVIDGCDGHQWSRGWCNMHYKRMKSTGSPETTHKPTAAERLWTKVEKTATCWNWTGALDPSGYGRFRFETQSLAHRAAYEIVKGVPAPAFLDHICCNRRCVNPDHLREVTVKQNGENRAGPTILSTTGALGVTKNSATTWRAQVHHNGRLYWGGSHSSIVEAEAAAVALRIELFTHNELDRARGGGDESLRSDRGNRPDHAR